MKINHAQDSTGGKFYAGQLSAPVVEINYLNSGNIMVIMETLVNEISNEPEGKTQIKDVVQQMVAEIVNFARQHGKKVASNCPYATYILKNSEEFKDTLYKQ